MPPALLPLLTLLLALALPARAALPQASDPATFDREYDRLARQQLAGGARLSDADLASLRARVPDGDAVRALRVRALGCALPGRAPSDALAAASDGLAAARTLGDRASEARFLLCRAQMAVHVHGPRAALADFTGSTRAARQARDRVALGVGLMQRGNARSLLGEQALALIDMQAARLAFVAAGLPAHADAHLPDIAAIYRRVGDHAKALEYLDASRRIAERDGDTMALYSDALQRGFIYRDLGRAHDSLASNERALMIAERLDDGHAQRGAARLGMAGAWLELGDPQRALRLVAQAREDFAHDRDPTYRGMLDLRSGQVHARLGDLPRALEHFNRAARVFEAEGNDRYRQMLYPERGRVLEAMGRPAAALADYKRHVALRESLQRRLGDQRSQLMRHQFDASRAELENRRLQAEKALREGQVETLVRARRWQRSALVLGVLLVLVLSGLALRQWRHTRRMRTLALTDELTGVANRRRLELYAEAAFTHACAERRSLGVLAFDIDHFKRINDAHGHAAGDRVLARVAGTCQSVLREQDLLGRTGGEEFIVVLPGLGTGAVEPVAERLRTAVERLRFDDLGPGLRVTISVGSAVLDDRDDTVSDLVRRADAALYRAKQNGRNQVEAAPVPA